jgi:hypothetical protein
MSQLPWRTSQHSKSIRGNDDDGHKNYYVGTPLSRFEYMKIFLSRIPEEIVDKYNLGA